MYRAVCLDIDGTLLPSEGLVSPRTLDALCRCHAQGLKNVAALGDAAPDLEMLCECGVGVAMGNATPGVKTAANR